MHLETRPGALEHEQQALIAAIGQLLSPLARLCLAKGISIQSVEDLMRKAFVDSAQTACEGLNPNRLTSRISTMTGLTRREVDRIRSAPTEVQVAVRSVAIEVLTRWASDPVYVLPDGRPRALPRAGVAPSFEALAESITTDVHSRSVLSEMQRLGLVAISDAGTVELLESIFVPTTDWPRMVGLMGDNVGDHLEGAVANLLGDGHQHFEQAVLADELSRQSIEAAQALITAQWRTLMTQLVPELQKLMDDDQKAGRTSDQKLRIGLYSYTSPMEGQHK